MIEASINTPVVLASNNSEIAFQRERNTRSATCCGWLSHNEGSPVFNITKPGLYNLEFNCTVTTEAVGIAALAIREDDAVLTDTIAAEQIAAVGNVANVSAHKVIRVCPNSNTQIEVGSVPAIVTDAIGTSTETQAPTIISGLFSITRISGC